MTLFKNLKQINGLPFASNGTVGIVSDEKMHIMVRLDTKSVSKREVKAAIELIDSVATGEVVVLKTEAGPEVAAWMGLAFSEHGKNENLRIYTPVLAAQDNKTPISKNDEEAMRKALERIFSQANDRIRNFDFSKAHIPV